MFGDRQPLVDTGRVEDVGRGGPALSFARSRWNPARQQHERLRRRQRPEADGALGVLALKA